MRKSMLTRLGAISLLLVAFQANALTINGINYKQFTSGGSKCPNGDSVMVYNGAKYCKSYRANLSWTIPATRADGTALQASELAGYEVYWTRSSDSAKGTIKVGNGESAVAAFEAYTPDTYYFAISAIDNKGLKSTLSSVAQTALGN
ncbi:MAG: hypothetical protein JWM78_3733 [Verrucomicrobiaceae bacterium]|nr:hypothetical protein [Verrucomicrobiaceae bacterium]